jgi:transcriptional antiterminator RfaH
VQAKPAPAKTQALGVWYLCVSKPRQEAYARERLLEQGFQVFLPELAVWAHRQGTWQCRKLAMFPRYVFFKPGRPEQAPGPAASTPGVSHLVRFGQVLACMPEQTLCALRALVEQRLASTPQHPLEPGARVVFCTGPLKGAQGIVSAVTGERVSVLMSLLGRESSVLARPRELAAA